MLTPQKEVQVVLVCLTSATYSANYEKTTRVVNDAAGQTRMKCTVYRFTRKNKNMSLPLYCITVTNGRIVQKMIVPGSNNNTRIYPYHSLTNIFNLQ